MDATRARQITAPLRRDPGLVIVTGRIGGGEMRIHDSLMLKRLECTFGASHAEANAVIAAALSLAGIYTLPLIVQSEPAA